MFYLDQYTTTDGAGVGRVISSVRGRLGVFKVWERSASPAQSLRQSFRISPDEIRDIHWPTLGFEWEDLPGAGRRGGVYSRTFRVAVPYWSIALVTAVLPAVGVRRLRRSLKRRRAGLCPICGYDLRATPERCPECGKQMRT